LRRRRRALGLTQEQASRLLGMHRLTYHRIETGGRRITFAELGHDLAHQLAAVVPQGPERTVSLRKSTEAKESVTQRW